MENEIINQYLTFHVDNEKYAINVASIREVLEFQSVSKVPRMPDFMRGVINLRGSVVPVIDLRMKFGLGEAEKTIETSVIVTEIRIGKKEVIIGLLTDSVSEVIEINEEDIEPAPNLGTIIDSTFILGMGHQDDQFIIILDINRVLSSGEISDFDSSKALKEQV